LPTLDAGVDHRAYFAKNGATFLPTQLFDRPISALSRGAPTVPGEYYELLKEMLKKLNKAQETDIKKIYGFLESREPHTPRFQRFFDDD
jgi:hypothetical protein